ncbi:coiled-coil domain-containing protein 180 isoform X1 [Thunnus albacares]|uniref:coiled-coil domain-containing protein 180 isoform X1 n=1 Tax=Thunnus albacares TaxID=8236 RepID=UPI001CF6CC4E|nr:coiled-coil domain-containing protein 180 isoform X1 [Thunnus albacares]
MCDSREVPSGKVYRQLFDAQVQLSRSLLAGRKDTRTDCLSAEHSDTHCSTASRLLCLSSRGQQVDDDDDDDDDDDAINDVSRLPDTVVVDRPSSDIIERLTQKKNKKHKEAVKQLDAELTALTQVCETQVKAISMDLLSSLQDVNLRLDTLKVRMEQLEHVSLQELCGLWEEVEEEVKLKKIKIMELNHKLTECETQRSNKIRAVLRMYCHLLEKISSQPPADIHSLIHSEATMLNQSLLANRRSAARLLLLLQEENLQQESLLHLHWEDCLNRWRRSRVSQVIDKFRSLCGADVEQQLISEQQMIQEMRQTQHQLTEQRCDIIHKISLLVPPSCSTALVCDWFNQLTAVNQQIDSLYTDFLHQLRCRCEQVWQDRLAEVQRCEEALSALQLSEEEVTDVVSSQLLTLIGQSQRRDEERLAALDLWAESVSRASVRLSRCVFVVMRAAALLWETHRRSLESREEDVQRRLDELRRSQEQHVQRKKVRLDDLLGGLRQESSEDALRTTLDTTVRYLQDIKHSCSQCVSDQWEVLDRLPSVFLEQLLSYSSSLSSFYRLSSTYTPSPEELQNLHLPSSNTSNTSNTSSPDGGGATDPEEMTEKRPISCQNDIDPAQPSQDWLAEAESSLLELYDITTYVTFTSSRGVAYTGPAFRCPAPNLLDDLQQETHENLFPVEHVTLALSRTRTLFLDHLEQRFHDVLSSAVAMVTDRKEAVRLDQELQLKQLDPQNIQNHIYLPRLAELQLHRQRVDDHCQLLVDVLSSCRSELQQLQTTISRKNHKFTISLSNMEDDVLTADCSQSLEALRSTLQDCVDHHIKQTQRSQTSFRQTVRFRLEDLRHRTTRLLDSFRLFSEGGDFAPQEVKLFTRRLKEETRQLSVTEESIYSQLETFESNSLQQVNEASSRFEEKLSLLQTELKFTEKIQKISSSTRVHIKAEAVSSNQHQSQISSRLEDLRRMMDDTQVSPDQVCLFLSSVSEELRKRCHYLDLSLVSACPTSRKQVRSAPPPGLLQPCRSGVDFLDDPAVGVVKSLNRLCVLQQQSADRQPTAAAAGQNPVQRLQQRSIESAGAQSVKRGCRSIRMEKRFQIFGHKPDDSEQNSDSFSSIVNSLLWKANDVLLLVAEEFYQTERCVLSRFHLVPDCLDQWAESMQQRLLGYQEQAKRFLSTSREELVDQLCVLEEMLRSLPSVLICNYEQQQEAELRNEVGGVREKLEETMAASEEEKTLNVRQLRASLSEDELHSLTRREELRQQRLHGAICCSHLDLQERVTVRGAEFVTSLTAFTENLLHQLDHLITPGGEGVHAVRGGGACAEETKAVSQQHSEHSAVTMETSSRTWSGTPHLSPPNNSTADLPASVTMATTASLAVIEQRDAAVKRFEQLLTSELSRSDSDKQRRLRDLQSWNTHWRQQIHTLTHTH